MKCEFCGEEIPESAAYCPKCGRAVQEKTYEQTVIEEDPFGFDNDSRTKNTHTKYCYNCGNPIDPTLPYCLKCGVSTERANSGYRSNNTGSYNTGSNRARKSVGFAEAYALYWKNYFNFKGRATRSEFWFVILWDLIISFGLSFFESLSGFTDWYTETLDYLSGLSTTVPSLSTFAMIVLIIEILWNLANFIPMISLAVRRLHDTGKSAMWLFIWFIPIAGTIILIIFLASASQPDYNQYG